MEEVYNPYANQGQEQYVPQQPAYQPRTNPEWQQAQAQPQWQQANGWQAEPQPQAAPQWNQQQPPQQQQMAPPQPLQQQQWDQQQQPVAPPQPAPQWNQQQPPPQWNQQQQTDPLQPPQMQVKAPVLKLPTQSGRPLKGDNLVMVEGYINNPKVTTLQDGSIRFGCFIVWEMPLYENGQPKLQENGYPEVRDVRYLIQAWGDVARALSQFPEGAPVKVYGMLNRWNSTKAGSGLPASWVVDIKVTRYEVR